MPSLILSFFVSLVLTGWVVHALGNTATGAALDHDVSGPQKFHAQAVPRVGGLGILGGMVAGIALLIWMQRSQFQMASVLLLCALPAVVAGLVEDFTKRVSPALRLTAIVVSAALAFWLLGAQVGRSDIPGLDTVLGYGAGAFAVTMLAVAGMANAVNIIDGFNGLASMCVVIMLTGLAYVAFQVGDADIGVLALVGIGAVLGFFVWNFPSGRIFLGDGGAYFLGFYFAELSILLLVRNPDVSPLVPFAGVHLPGLRDAVFDLSAALPARRADESARRHPPAFADLPAPVALDGGRQQRQVADAAQFDDLAVLVGSLHALGGACRAVLGELRRDGSLAAGVRVGLRGAVLAHRALPVAAVAAQSGQSTGAAVGAR